MPSLWSRRRRASEVARVVALLLFIAGCATPCEHGVEWWLKPKVRDQGGAVEFRCRAHARAPDEDEKEVCDEMKHTYHLDLCWKKLYADG